MRIQCTESMNRFYFWFVCLFKEINASHLHSKGSDSRGIPTRSLYIDFIRHRHQKRILCGSSSHWINWKQTMAWKGFNEFGFSKCEQSAITMRQWINKLICGGRRVCSVLLYLVEDSESFSDLLLAVCIFHFPGHHGQELREVNCTVA